MLSEVLVTALIATELAHIGHFQPVDKAALPAGFVAKMCTSDPLAPTEACPEEFARNGAVWAGDVNDDGIDEYIIDPGGVPGTLGPARNLVQLRGAEWVELACLNDPEQDCKSDWNTLRARFDILPIIRAGYHDLRIEVDHCIKWDGRRYIDYQADDYARLKAEWFDLSDSHDAELFWTMRYAGKENFRFEPVWFNIDPQELGATPRPYIGFPVRVVEYPVLPYVSRRDSEDKNLTWVSLFKGGIWGLRGNRAFLLVPQLAYLGAQRLEIRGDWLLIYGRLEQSQPNVRYNRRTHELHFMRTDD